MPNRNLNLCVLPTPADLFQAAATEFAQRAAEAIQSHGRFCVALSGGSTPKGLFTLLADSAKDSVAWDNTYLFWGDERHVPPDHADSNFRMTQQALLSHVPIPPRNVFRIHAEESDADAAAQSYEDDLRRFFQLKPAEFPRFDLMLQGMGPDGHTASLFPNSPALSEEKRLVVANWIEKFQHFRITMTYPVLNHAAHVVFLVSGNEKAEALHQVLEDDKANLPSQRVHPLNGELLWLVDASAAAALGR